MTSIRTEDLKRIEGPRSVLDIVGEGRMDNQAIEERLLPTLFYSSRKLVETHVRRIFELGIKQQPLSVINYSYAL